MVKRDVFRKFQFDEWFTTHYEPLCRYVYKILGDTELAREVAQNAFVKLWEKGDFQQPEFVIRAFLYTIAYRESIDYLRRKVLLSNYRRQILLEHANNTESPSDTYAFTELKLQLDQIVAEFPPRRKAVFCMSRYDRLKNREIAEKLGISVKTVEAHLSEALQVIKSKFSRK